MSDLAIKVMELIEEGKNVITNQPIKPQVVMFLGITGAGKSSLINYISGVQLESFSENGGTTFKLKAKDHNQELPGIKIGHSTASCTTYPGICSPLNETFTYIDTPGFGDTGRLSNNNNMSDNTQKNQRVAQDIANAYFRSAIIEKANDLKIVLVVTHQDLDARPGTLPKSLRDLARFIQSIETDDPAIVEKIKQSISIVVTKVEDTNIAKIARIKAIDDEIASIRDALNNTNNSNPTVINVLQNVINGKELEKQTLQQEIIASSPKQAVEISLRNFIDASPELREFRNILSILNFIVDNERYAVFSTPKIACDKDSIEATEIQNLIHNQTTFISKQEANIAIRVSDENSAEVIKALEKLKIVGANLAKCIDKDIRKKLEAAFSKGRNERIQKIKSKCEAVKDYTSLRTLEAFFNDINKELKLSPGTVREFEAFNKLFTLLIGLLPEADRSNYSDKNNWIEKLGLKDIFEAHIKCAEDILSAQTVNFANGKVTIQGYHIKTSQVDVEIQKFAGIKDIEIRALHTITIDNDLTNNNSKCVGKLYGVNLTMIAPNVAVSGNRTIDLSGKSGDTQPKAANGGNGSHGAKVGVATRGNSGANGGHGADGLPGQSGGSAGNLSIICKSFPNHDNLSVNLKGGNGGKGQDGGFGGTGGNGSGVTWLEVSGFHGAIKFIMRDGWEPMEEKNHHANGQTDQKFILKGGNGGVGGNGGQGGKGGDAGKGGQFRLIADNQVVSINNLSTINGQSGTNGAAGEPGHGGAHGRSAKGEWHTGGNPDNGWSGHYLPHYVESGSAASGVKPTTTINQNGWLAASATPHQNLAVALLDYAVYLEQQANKYPDIVANHLYAFEEHCEHIKLIDLKTTTKDLLQAANTLENYSIDLGKTIDIAPFYYSLLARIKDFALNPAKTPQEIKVLEYLYVATLGSIARLNAAADNLLVIDIHQYVKDLVNKDLATLKAFQANQLRDYYRAQYQEGIESKIEEAQSFLRLLKEDIRSRQQEIEPLITQLVQEVNTLKNDQLAERSKVEAKRRELEAALHKKAMLGVMSIAIQAVGMMFPPAGPIIGALVNAGLNMAANPSIETAVEFASKAVDMKTKLGNLPTGANVSKHEVDLFKKVQEMAKTIAPLIKDAKDLLSQQHAGNAQLAQLDSQIVHIDSYIIQLNAFLATVPATLSNYLVGMVNQVQSFQTALEDKSLVALDFGKLELKRFFENMKRNIKTVVGNFKTDGFEELATKMQEAMDVSLTICSRVQEYRDHIAFANFIAHLQSANVQNVVVGAEYQQAVDDLNFRLQKSIVQEAYYRAIAAAKQWAFPFTEKFFSAISNLDTNDVTVMAQNLTALLRRLAQYKTCIDTMDQALTLSPFTTVAPTIPFFTWSYELQPRKIEALLKGEKVLLSADVTQSQLDAVKFNQIGIKFECALSAKQAELETTLQDSYKVTLEHSGVSYYKYAGNIYQVTNDKPLEISYSFKMKADGETPEIVTNAWNKMQSGDILLSPYTSWVVKIEPVSTAIPTVSLLDKFNDVKHHLKVRLVGKGSYVDTSRVNSNLNVDRYHHKINKEESLAISRKLSCYGLFKPIKSNNNNQPTVEESVTNTNTP